MSYQKCWNMRVGSLALLSAAMLAGGLPVRSGAQDLVQAPKLPTTAAEYDWGLNLYVSSVLTPVSGYGSLVRPDSVEPAIKDRTHAWILQLQAAPVKGLQLDPLGELYVADGQDAVAKRQFAERLATKGLSQDDRAYTLLLATRVFAHPENPERIQAALGYMAEIDALPATAIMWKFRGHVTLGEAYYVTGDGPAVTLHITKALAMTPQMPFERRQPVYHESPIVMLADVLSGVPGGPARIDSMGKALLPLATPTAEQIAKDSMYFWLGHYWTGEFKGTLQLTAHLGRTAPAVTAMHWYNTDAPTVVSTAAPGAQSKALNDGVIRLMEFGEYSCYPCRMALPGMERIRKAAPSNVQVWYVTQTEGSWGATVYSPNDESQHLEHYYVERKHYGMPIALWAGPKDSTQDYGSLPRENPSAAAYPIQATPTFIVVDGKGIVRHISIGYSKEVEKLLSSDIQYLAGEAKRQTSTTPALGSPPVRTAMNDQ
jgi:thiol-disulfide isomerase/thioredoxin